MKNVEAKSEKSAAKEHSRMSLWNFGELSLPPKTFEFEASVAENFEYPTNGVTPIWIEGENFRGKTTRIFAWWGLPKGASAENKVPAMVLIHGGAGTAYAEWVKTWNERGYAAIAMDTCGKIPCRGKLSVHPWSGPTGADESVVAAVDEPLRDQWTFHAVSAAIRCHSFLRSRPEIESEKIGLTGISWGGYLASIVMSVDPRFKFAAPVYGCAWYELSPKWTEYFGDTENYEKWRALWDAKHFLVDIDRFGIAGRVLWCTGTNDEFYPLAALKRSYKLLEAHDIALSLSLKLRMPHGHPPYGDPKEISALADAVLRDGAPLPEISAAKTSCEKVRGKIEAHGHTLERAELLITRDANPNLFARSWEAVPIENFDSAAGTFEVKVGGNAAMYFINVITASGLVISSKIFE